MRELLEATEIGDASMVLQDGKYPFLFQHNRF